MKCEKCSSDMHWEGSMRSGHMECACCKAHCEQLPLVEVEIFNAQVIGIDPAASIAAFKILRRRTSDISVVICPICGEDFNVNSKWSSAECPACHYCGVIEQ